MQRVGDVRWEPVQLPPKERLQSQAAAGQGKDVTTKRSNYVLSLPELAALDGSASVKDMVGGQPNQLCCVRWWPTLPFDYRSGYGSELGPERSELGCGRKKRKSISEPFGRKERR